MNSLIQQLNMVETFRETILETEDQGTLTNEESALFQLKNIFASLKYFEGKYHNPKDFCNNFKKYDGQVINIIEQMDVDEFFNLLIERVEPFLKSTPYEKVFKYHFGGKITNELICKDCPHKNEREDLFSSISLQVKNKKNLLESLESFVEGEMMEGDNAYLCEPCEKKVRALRRQSIKKLPRHLVLALRRFEFDYETMLKVKVNDAFEFPMELDMEPYTQEYLIKKEREDKIIDDKNKNDEENTDKDILNLKKTNSVSSVNKNNDLFKYKLTGVIIHTGTADSGHYYSIVKDKKENWLEFNDTNVSYYDIADLPGEAFGGIESFTYKDQTKVEKVTNAYLLFYEKVFNSEAAEVKESEEGNKIVNQAKISTNIMDRINLDNFQYWVSKILFSAEYFEFIQDLVLNYKTFDHYILNYSTKNVQLDSLNSFGYCNVNDNLLVKHTNIKDDNKLRLNDPNFELTIFKFTVNFFFTILIRAKEKLNHIANMMDIVKAQINRSAANAEWLLEEFTNSDTILEFIVDTPILDIRKLSVGLLYCSMLKLYPIVKNNMIKMETATDALSNFIKTIIMIISLIHKKDLTQLNALLWRFSKLGIESITFLVNIGYFEFILIQYNLKLGNKNELQIQTTQPLDILKKIRPDPVKHKEISKKLTSRPDRHSYMEELQEKKHLEKLPNPNNSHVLMTFSEIIRTVRTLSNTTSMENNIYYNKCSSTGLELEKELKSLIQLNKSAFLKVLILESKSKSSANALSSMLAYISFNNGEVSTMIQSILLEMIDAYDSMELEYIMRIFFNFITLEDNLREQRVNNFI